MNITDVMKTYHVSRKALLVYEDKGLITPDRNKAGYRIYDEENVIKIKKIILLRKLDFSLIEIEAILQGHNEIYEKKNEYMEQIETLKIKSHYLNNVYYALKTNQQIDETIQLIDSQLETKELDEDIIPFTIEKGGFMIMWMIAVGLSIHTNNIYFILSTLLIGACILMISYKNKISKYISTTKVGMMMIISSMIGFIILSMNESSVYYMGVIYSMVLCYGITIIPSLKKFSLLVKSVIVWLLELLVL